MKLNFLQLTSIGDRESNQDYMVHDIKDDYALFIVADGLGGYRGGEMASSFFCKGMLHLAPRYSKLIAKKPSSVLCAWIDAAIDEMDSMFAGDSIAYSAFTTCAILFIQKDIVITAHCGDSRIYRMNNGKIIWRSKDHSIPQMLVDKGEVEEMDMGVHAEQNQLTRSINVAKNYAPEIKVHSALIPYETFLLCSDGFWGFTKQREFLKLARPGCEKKDLLKQVKTVYLRAEGKSDNLSVQWVNVTKL